MYLDNKHFYFFSDLSKYKRGILVNLSTIQSNCSHGNKTGCPRYFFPFWFNRKWLIHCKTCRYDHLGLWEYWLPVTFLSSTNYLTVLILVRLTSVFELSVSIDLNLIVLLCCNATMCPFLLIKYLVCVSLWF